jgi:hypothetical protein
LAIDRSIMSSAATAAALMWSTQQRSARSSSPLWIARQIAVTSRRL